MTIVQMPKFIEEERERADTLTIQEGLDAIAAGPVKPLEQCLDEQRIRRGLPDNWPASVTLNEVAPASSGSSEHLGKTRKSRV